MLSMKKYELTNETKRRHDGTVVHRIRALVDFADVKAGDLGGWVQSEANLSHEENAWVADEAVATSSATVLDNAWVGDHATVSRCATICDNALVHGCAKVEDCATVRGYAQVHGNSIVGGDAEVSGQAIILDHVGVYGCSQIHGGVVINGCPCFNDEANISCNDDFI